MTQEETKTALDNIRTEIKNLSNRELLEQIYVLLNINTLSTISANSSNAMLNMQAVSLNNIPRPYVGINNQFGNL